jgi:hypothetical protein
LNASGRLSNAERSLRLLLTQDESEAAALAEVLDKENRDRQAVEKEIHALRSALEKSDLDLKNRRDSQQQALQFLQGDAELSDSNERRGEAEPRAAKLRHHIRIGHRAFQVVHRSDPVMSPSPGASPHG